MPYDLVLFETKWGFTMNNKNRFFHSSVFKLLRGGLTATLAVALILFSVASNAQEQTSSIRGTVASSDGSPAAGASVRVTDTRTGAGRSTTTDGNGVFTASRLRIGGPYTVEITATGQAEQTITDVFVALGETYTFDVALSPDTMDEIVVMASALAAVQVAIGPSATFSLEDLQDAPAINRDITDVVRIDPRMHVDEAGNRGDSIHCGGAHHRFNSLTIDGVRMNDQFGLNSNGYPTARQPFSYDAIQQVAVEMAPFDVQYGGFTACNINAVTRSGTNEFHGSAFYDYTNDSFIGDKLEGDDVDLDSWDKTRYGFSIGGPIIEDKLFFFAAYEKLDGAELFARSASDASSAGTFVQGVTQAQLDRIGQIARNVYQYEPGEAVRTLPVEDEKILLKLDWEINDDHRAALTYMYNDGFNIAESDGDSNEFEFSNHYYTRGAELDSGVAQVFSNWSDNFSTEFRVSYADLFNIQDNIFDDNFGEVQIRTYANGTRTTVYLGADDSRQTNDLNWDTFGLKFTGEYTMGDHTISFGVERDDLEVFNLFVQETQGEFEFEATCSSTNPDGCIDAFESGDPDDITYESGANSNNPLDAGVTWGYEINSAYIQDEIQLMGGDFTLIAGLRHDWYTSSDLPIENQNFIDRNGFTNATNFDGESLTQPRLGFNWEVNDDLTLRGGVGMYSGGNPNVWLSNNYSNNGILTAESDDSDIQGILGGLDHDGIGGNTLFTIPHTSGDGPGGNLPIWNIPQDMYDDVAGATGNFAVNGIDPNFKIPSAWKYALGATYRFGNDWTVSVDFQHSKGEDDAIVLDGTLEQIGNAPDGRPLYQNVDRSDHGFIPDDGSPQFDYGCYDPDGTLNPDARRTTDPTRRTCSSRLFASDYILSNVKDGNSEQTSFSAGISKSHDWGLDWTFAYTHVESDDVSPMTSFVAFSNYASIAVSDPQNPGQARSNYEFSDRFILRANYRKVIFGDLMTRVTVFGSANAGRPYSATFADGGFTFGNIIDDQHLLYVPTGPSDSNVVFLDTFDQDAFFTYVEETGLSKYAGGIVKRNSFTSDWWTKFDIKIEQELPGFAPEHRFAAFFYIENFGNLLNDDWGVLKEASFPRFQAVVEFPDDGSFFRNDDGINDSGQYVFKTFLTPDPQSRAADASLWEIRFGVKYNF